MLCFGDIEVARGFFEPKRGDAFAFFFFARKTAVGVGLALELFLERAFFAVLVDRALFAVAEQDLALAQVERQRACAFDLGGDAPLQFAFLGFFCARGPWLDDVDDRAFADWIGGVQDIYLTRGGAGGVVVDHDARDFAEFFARQRVARPF